MDASSLSPPTQEGAVCDPSSKSEWACDSVHKWRMVEWLCVTFKAGTCRACFCPEQRFALAALGHHGRTVPRSSHLLSSSKPQEWAVQRCTCQCSQLSPAFETPQPRPQTSQSRNKPFLVLCWNSCSTESRSKIQELSFPPLCLAMTC